MDQLKRFLGSEARARLLAHFVVHPESDLHVRALERHTGLRSRSLQLELERLERMRLLRREQRGRRVAFVRERAGPEWRAIEVLVRSYATFHLIREALANVPGVKAVCVFGSVVRGDARPDSDVDVLVYGDEILDREFGAALLELNLLLDRKIDVKRYDTRSFLRDVATNASFLPKALAGPIEWLVGSSEALPERARETAA